MTALPCQRHRFSLPDDFHYLNCAYMGPLPGAAERAGIAGLRAKRFPQAIAPEDFFRPADELRARFARLINAPDPNCVATVPSVSYAASTIARNTEAGPGSNVVIVHEQFPGNVYPWRRLVDEKGGELRVVGPVGGGVRGEGWTDRILERIDSATVAVAMGTVHWTDGTRFDVQAVRERTRAVGAALILDGTQTVGALPVDVRALPRVCRGVGRLKFSGPPCRGRRPPSPPLPPLCRVRRTSPGAPRGPGPWEHRTR